MHTTGLAREPIGRLYERDTLAAALREAREHTLAIYAHLDLASLAVPCIPIVNPPLWELAHIAWFQEYWCLRRRGRPQAEAPSQLEGADALLDSTAVAHESRWTLPYPPAQRLYAYMASTLEATLEALDSAPEPDRYFFMLALLHEDMHGEALAMTLQTLGLPPPPFAREPSRSVAAPDFDVSFEGGEWDLGARRESRDFVFDNEKWAHAVTLAPFAIAAGPTTQGQFAAFVDDDGYSRSEFWSAEGWAWREEADRDAPRHWKAQGDGWRLRRFDRWIALEPHAPMVHVNQHEARAYCRWAGRRLPTEAEWEFAARNGGDQCRYPWGDDLRASPALDFQCRAAAFRPDGSTRSAKGLEMMVGGVWEWTASPFEPYPGFAPDPYREYSQPWFGSHAVLRGGSFLTRGRLVHNGFRNFYVPDRSDVFAGFRTCAGETT